LIVRAPGQLLQERVCFSHDVQRGPRLRQLGLEFRIAGAEPFQLHRLRGLLRLFHRPPRISHTRQSAGIPVLQQHIELILPVGLVDQVVAGVVE
jgi:hypothetical protein